MGFEVLLYQSLYLAALGKCGIAVFSESAIGGFSAFWTAFSELFPVSNRKKISYFFFAIVSQ